MHSSEDDIRTHAGAPDGAHPDAPDGAHPDAPDGAHLDAPAGAHLDAPAGARHWWTATGHERPVFLDERGRRRRWVLAGGALAGGLAALWLTALLAGAIGFSTMPTSYGPKLGARPHSAADLRRTVDLRRATDLRRTTADLRRTTADLRRDQNRA
jgi:hypothetical protein